MRENDPKDNQTYAQGGVASAVTVDQPVQNYSGYQSSCFRAEAAQQMGQEDIPPCGTVV